MLLQKGTVTMSNVNKSLATARIGEEMQRRGWTIFGYVEDRSDSMSDYYSPASWRGGVATHSNWPGVVVGMDVYSTSRSGQDDTSSEWVPTEPCVACSGTGIQVGAITYQEALTNPEEAHKNKREREDGWRVVRFGGPAVSRHDYHEDGSAKCMECLGRGHDLREIKTVVRTWPVFQGTPKGKSWHVETNGKIHETGVGLSHCDGYSGWEASVQRIVKDIEAAAARAHATHNRRSDAAVTAAAIGDTSLLPTEANGHGFTVKVEYEAIGSSVKSIITTIPRLPKPDWYRLRDGFGVSYDRKSGQVSKWKFVAAQDVLDFLRPPTTEELAARTVAVASGIETPAQKTEVIFDNPAYADPIEVALAFTASEVGVIDASSLAQQDTAADTATADEMRYVLANANRYWMHPIGGHPIVHQIGGYIILGVSAPNVNDVLVFLMMSFTHASPKVYQTYDEAEEDANRLHAAETGTTTVQAAIPVEAQAETQTLPDDSETAVPAIYMIITPLTYDRATVLPRNTTPLGSCGDFEIIKTSESDVDALYDAMNQPAAKENGTTLMYSEEYATLEEAVAKAQRATFTRHNLSTLTTDRKARIVEYNHETHACAVEMYEAAPATIEDVAVIEDVEAIEAAMLTDPAVALAILAYDISMVEDAELSQLTGLRAGTATADFQHAWGQWIKANPGDLGESVQGAYQRYSAFLNTPTPDTRWLAAMANADAYLGFSARWDGEALGRWRLVRVEKRDAEWQAMRFASGMKGGVTVHTERASAEAEMQMQYELDAPRRYDVVPQIEAPTEVSAEVVEGSLWSETNPAWLNELFSVKNWGDEKTARKQRDLRAKQLRAGGWNVTVKSVTVMDSRWFELMGKAPGFDGPIITYGGSKGSSSSTWVKPEMVDTLYRPQAVIEPVVAEAAPVEVVQAEAVEAVQAEAVEAVQAEAVPQPECTASFKAITPKAKRGSKVVPDAVQWAMF